jgi:hypothetical protein
MNRKGTLRFTGWQSQYRKRKQERRDIEKVESHDRNLLRPTDREIEPLKSLFVNPFDHIDMIPVTFG